MQDQVLYAAIAGLLHDVGKLEQRAADDPRFPPEGTQKDGQPVHAAFTQAFVDGIPERYRPAARAGVYHHQPLASPAEDKHLSELVALADKLSAGERADTPAEEWTYPRQMVTIFDRIGDRQGESAPEKLHFLPLCPLALEHDAIFPGAERKKDSRDDYIVLRDFLRAEARRDIPDPQTYVENLLGAMQRTTWCVPSAFYHSIPDVSLFDHARMTAALAGCLAERPAEEIQMLLGAVERCFWGKPEDGDTELLEKPIAMLVGGGISGTQDFIYTISSKGAAKMLRGRSFYLQLLTEAVLRFVLRGLGLPYTNVIYSGGGNFYLLAPVSAAEKLPGLQAEISRILLIQHGIGLYLALGSTRVPAHGFHIGEFPKYWSSMHEDLTNAKTRRYAELGAELHKRVFIPPEFGGNPKDTCSICGDDRRGAQPWDELEEQANICPLCRSFEPIGLELPRSRFLALKFSEPTKRDKVDTALEVLAAFGMDVQFLQDEDTAVEIGVNQYLVLWALDDHQDDRWPRTSRPAARWLRYTVNQIPFVKNQAEADEINDKLGKNVAPKDRAVVGQPKTFSHLNVQADSEFRRLGVLRMDVDNLGEVFSKGLGKQATLARLSTLSFQMSLFFEGWLKRLVEQGERENLIYTVYSGGDDLFLIGPWDRIPDLARDIARDFHEYTAKHPGLHISGGMVFIDGKYPVYQAAEDAAEAEEQAKRMTGKNAFSFLSRAWHWEEFEQLAQKKEQLMRIVEGEEQSERGGPKSLLQVLRSLARMESEAARDRPRPLWGRWMWLGAYLLKRAADRYEKSRPALAQEIEALRKSLEGNDYQDILQWGAAARWAQLATRKPAKQ